MGKYAKAIVATIGAGATAALGILAPHTGGWDVAEVLAAMSTAAAVYLVPNQPATSSSAVKP
jgi:hypothetical protein